MEKPIDFGRFDYISSIDVLSNLSPEEKDKNVVIANNKLGNKTIKIVDAHDTANSTLPSDLEFAIENIVEYANRQIKSGILPEETQRGLKRGLTLLGENLHNPKIAKMAQKILVEDFIVMDAPSPQDSPGYLHSAWNALSVLFSRPQEEVPLPPISTLTFDVRKAHVYTRLDTQGLLNLAKTSTLFLSEVRSSGVLRETVRPAEKEILQELIDEAKKGVLDVSESNRRVELFLTIATIQDLVGDTEGANESRMNACKWVPEYERVRFVKKRIAQGDRVGAEFLLNKIIVSETDDFEKMDTYLQLFELHRSLPDTEAAKRDLKAAKEIDDGVPEGEKNHLKRRYELRIAKAETAIGDLDGLRETLIKITRHDGAEYHSMFDKVPFLIALGEIDEAKKILDQALQVSIQKDQDYRAKDMVGHEITNFINMCSYFLQSGDPARAMQVYTQHLQPAMNLFIKSSYYKEHSALNSVPLANLQIALGEQRDAGATLNRERDKLLKNKSEENSLLEIAKAQIAIGDEANAKKTCGYIRTYLQEQDSPVFNLLWVLEIYLTVNDLKGAYATLDQAEKICKYDHQWAYIAEMQLLLVKKHLAMGSVSDAVHLVSQMREKFEGKPSPDLLMIKKMAQMEIECSIAKQPILPL